MAVKIADIRKNYSRKKLSETKANPDPLKQFTKWWNQALKSKIEEANAMTLATASPDGLPSARMVLLKGFGANGFTFFTNYNSYKGKQLSENPKACLVFFWKVLERQVRITGLVEKISEEASNDYFLSRPVESQLGAIASPQSEVIESREWLDEKFKRVKKEMGKNNIQRPSNWGGFIVKPVIIEFWQGRPSRLHDRLQYTLQESGHWKIERLAP
jgi:pyridoxamine 5'-phosphate oxidase